MPGNVHRVNVRTLAEFATQSGDIFPSAGLAERMREGIMGHKMLQAEYPEHYTAEASVSRLEVIDGVSLQIFGRIDGRWTESDILVIEEIKTTEQDPSTLQPDDYPAHWAQAHLYAAIVVKNESVPRVRIRLTYCTLSGSRTTFTREYDDATLISLFQGYLEPYAAWLRQCDTWRGQAASSIRALPFPFVGYRKGQREMAANVFVALRDSKNLLCQAPTGTGKTIAALYPALKALNEGHISRIFYLTARSTAGRSAQEAMKRMRMQGLIARSVTLTAKEKACISHDMNCDPDLCPRARGHYDRLRAGLYDAFHYEDLDTETIASLSEKHGLCPFEFSLDLSEVAEVIICDYNYVFDPRVRLQRYFQSKTDCALLIDEAHNLASRAREMLSVSLQQREIKELRTMVGKELKRSHPLYRMLTSILSTLSLLGRTEPFPDVNADLPSPLINALKEALPVMQEQLQRQHTFHEYLLSVFYTTMDFLRVAESYDEHFRTLYRKDHSLVSVQLWCADPSGHLAKCYARVHGVVLFSATLSPMPFYRDILGLREKDGDALLSLPSPFPSENLCVMQANLSTRYRKREETIHELTGMILSFIRARTGNYLICFPSYAYMRKALSFIEPLAVDFDLLIQQSEMDETERIAFLANFVPNPKRSLAGFIAMGGIFSEGIDLAGDRLNGAMIVGVGIPQVCQENDVLRDLYEERFAEGYHYAYTYPGMSRVLQAAGRVIRSETDRGMLLLVDERWNYGVYRKLIPDFWKLRPVFSSTDIQNLTHEFYQENQQEGR